MMTTEKRFLGESPEFLAMLRTAGLLAPTDATVLITGESGTGKELVSQYIHQQSRRAKGPWVSINCAALPESLAEAELFGHNKGAFTGAGDRRGGRVQAASGGTLFLDEIAELPLSIQPKLLRLLESGECQVLGQTDTTRVNIRVVAATNKNLLDMVQTGQFRADLFYRLNVVPLELPPLRQRTEDIPVLTRAFFQEFSQKNRLETARFSAAALTTLKNHHWSGNIRELRNLCERLSILHAGQTIDSDDLPLEIRTAPQPGTNGADRPFTLPDSGINLVDLEQNLIGQALQRASGNKSHAARLLGLSRDTFLYRLKKFAIPL